MKYRIRFGFLILLVLFALCCERDKNTLPENYKWKSEILIPIEGFHYQDYANSVFRNKEGYVIFGIAGSAGLSYPFGNIS